MRAISAPQRRDADAPLTSVHVQWWSYDGHSTSGLANPTASVVADSLARYGHAILIDVRHPWFHGHRRLDDARFAERRP